MIRRPPRPTRTAPLLPYTRLFRSENAVQRSEQGALWHRLGLDGCRRSLLFGGSPIYARSAAVRPAAGREPAGPDQARQHAQRNLARIAGRASRRPPDRSEEHTSELQSLMRISYAVFCLKKKKKPTLITKHKTKILEKSKNTNTNT